MYISKSLQFPSEVELLFSVNEFMLQSKNMPNRMALLSSVQKPCAFCISDVLPKSVMNVTEMINTF